MKLFGIFFLLVAAISWQGYAQERYAPNPSKRLGQYNISTWGPNEGLPSKSLTRIMQSSDGYLWIGSYNGFYRFDGVAFKTFSKAESSALLTNSFAGAQERPSDRKLFIATGGSGLLMYQGDSLAIWGDTTDRFTHPIESFYFAPDGKIWIGSRGEGLFICDNGKCTPFADNPLLQKVGVLDILKDRDGTLWFATEGNGLVGLKDGGYKHFSPDNGLLDRRVSSLYQDARGVLWIGGNKGLNYVDTLGNIQVLPGTEGYFVNDIEGDAYGSIWFGTTRGLFRHSQGRLEFIGEAEGLPNSNVLDLVIDREGALWLTTYGGGLCRLKDTYFENYGAKNGIVPATINGVCELGNGKIMLSNGNSLFVIANQEVQQVKLKTPLPSAKIKHVVQTKTGKILLSTYSGLLVINPDGTERLIDTKNGLDDIQVRTAFEDRDGNVWVGTRSGGITRIDGKTGAMEVFSAKNQRISSNFIMSIDEDNEGSLLVGTNNAGLDVLLASGEVKNYGSDVIGTALIFNVHIDQQNNWWMATNAGLTLRTIDGKFHRFTKNDGLGSDVLFDVLEDGKGNMWITSSDGLLSLPKQQFLDVASGKRKRLEATVYGKDDGMIEGECTGVTQSLLASNGKLYFPTLGGITIFDPNYRLPNPPQPPVYVHQLLADGHNVDLSLPEIKLDSDIKRIVLKYTALHLGNADRVRFQYRLQGYEDWIDAGDDRRAIYTNLAPGWHEFHVRAQHQVNGNWEGASATSIKFYRAPHFYETNIFYVMAALLTLSSAFLVYRVRIARIKKRNIMLERLVQERTQQVEEKQAKVLEQNEELRIKQEEILTQNEELHQQRDEILAQRDHIEHKNLALERQKEEIERAYTNVSLLTDIGQEITALLDMPTIINSTYERVNKLMDASGFGIGIVQDGSITFKGYLEKGNPLPDYSIALNPDLNLASWVIVHKEGIIVDDFMLDAPRYIKVEAKAVAGEAPESLIYLPLMLKGQAIGAITVQSFRKSAYSENDMTLLRNMAAYVSIAVDNAHAYEEVMRSRSIIERKNNDIMDSLRYAETIQKSVLPTAAFINQYVASHFVIFRPKDVVSGDFYWCKNVGNKFFAAVVDCTGHGVPGAFMGLIGNDLLDNIIVRDRIFDPAQILEGMHQGIKRVLQQDKQLNSDGMDLGLCMVEYQENDAVSVVYAGAKRPLYYWDGGDLKEVKGDRRSVGGWQKDENASFNNHSMQLKRGNVLYLTTDGFIDQSSPARKKYGSIRLTEQMRAIAGLDMAAQCAHLEQELDSHQGDQEQRDDITLMGILL